MSNGLIIAIFIGCFGFVLFFMLYRFWSFVKLRQLAAQQGWTLAGRDRAGGCLSWLNPADWQLFAIEGDGWRYAATSRITGVRIQTTGSKTHAQLRRSANAVWASTLGGIEHPVLLMPQLRGRDQLNNPVTKLLFSPGDLATEIAQFIAEDYPTNEKLAFSEGWSVADFSVYTSDENTAKHLLDSPELGTVLAGWSNATERYARRPGILLYPGGVRLSVSQVETRPKHVQRLIELGEELVRITTPATSS